MALDRSTFDIEKIPSVKLSVLTVRMTPAPHFSGTIYSAREPDKKLIKADRTG